MVDRIAQAIWFVILLVCLFAALQYLSPQPVPDQDKEEKTVCGNQTKYSYEVDGNRYYVPYSTIDGQDVVEGDIVIGQAEGSGYFPPTVQPFVNGQATRWPGNVVPFIIDGSAEPFRPFIERAMTEWASHTNVKFEELSGIRDWRKENYVKFIKDSICESNSLGIKEKDPQQTDEEKNKINIVKVGGCYMDGKLSWGRIAHEIGHVLGLGHEHSRRQK